MNSPLPFSDSDNDETVDSNHHVNDYSQYDLSLGDYPVRDLPLLPDIDYEYTSFTYPSIPMQLPMNVPMHLPENDYVYDFHTRDTEPVLTIEDTEEYGEISEISGIHIVGPAPKLLTYKNGMFHLDYRGIVDIGAITQKASFWFKVTLILITAIIIGNHYKGNFTGLAHRTYEAFTTFYGLYIFYYLTMYRVEKIQFKPWFRSYVVPVRKFVYKYVLLRHIYINRYWFFILNMGVGIFYAALCFPIVRLSTEIFPDSPYQIPLFPGLYLQRNTSYYLQSSPYIAATLMTTLFYILFMALKLMSKVTADQDQLAQFSDQINNGELVTGDARHDYLKVVATSSLEGDLSNDVNKENLNEN